MTATAPEELLQPPAPVRGRMLPLDGLRGVAVLLVVVYHTQYAWALGGDMGVQVFFVLSGYLITTLLLRERTRFGTIRLGDFYVRRALRLVPALYVGVAAVLLVAATGWGTTGATTSARELVGQSLVAATYFTDVAAAFALQDVGGVAGWLGRDMGALLHTWSLSVEEHFYVLWPPLLLLVLKLRPRLVVPFALVIAVVTAAWRWHLVEGEEVFTRAILDRTRYGFDVRADALAIGCALAAALHFKRVEVPAVVQRTAGWVGAAGLAWLLWSAGTIVGSSPTCQLATRCGDYYREAATWGYTAQAVAAALLIWGLLPDGDALLRKVLAVRPLVHIGTISYGLYLWNYLAIKLVGPADLPFDGRYSTLLTRIGIGFVLAELSYWLVEQPFLRLKDRRFGRRE